jgi:ferric-chelate reductase [NAD(P)H]
MIDPKALFKIQYGMYLITSKCDECCNGQIATVVFQVTSKPLQLAVCLSKETYTYELVMKSRVIGISILEEDTPTTFIGGFGYRCGRTCNKFDKINFETSVTGVPLVTDYALVIMDGKIAQVVDVGTHSLFVVDLHMAKELKVGKAMTYEYYHEVRKMKTPKNAPTFLAN